MINNPNYNFNDFWDIPGKPGKNREIWIKKFKKKKGCSKCGYNICDEALHFHHIDIKNKNVSMLKQYPTWQVIKEIYSCIILCANCHIELHKEMQ